MCGPALGVEVGRDDEGGGGLARATVTDAEPSVAWVSASTSWDQRWTSSPSTAIDPVPGPEAGLRRQRARVDRADGRSHRVVGAHREEDGQEQHCDGPAAQGAGGEDEHPAPHRERGERDPGCTRRVVRVLSLEAEPASEGDGPERPALPERAETEQRWADPKEKTTARVPKMRAASRCASSWAVRSTPRASSARRARMGCARQTYQWDGSVDTAIEGAGRESLDSPAPLG
jgi:hypothetical protein